MFKIIFLLMTCYFCYGVAFICGFPCPENSVCTAQDKCTCNYGYKEKISEFDGFPYCQWQGTTTTKKVPTDLRVEQKIYETNEDDLVDDNSELFGDYRYQKEPHNIQTEEELKKQKQKFSNLFKANRFAIVRDTTVTEEIPKTTFSVIPFGKSRKAPSLPYEEQEDEESNSFKKLLLENEISKLYNLNNQEKTTKRILNKNLNLNNLETTTTASVEATTDATHIVKVIKHVEQRIHSGSAVQTFYTSLGVFCTFLAFLFAVTVMFDCVKL